MNVTAVTLEWTPESVPVGYADTGVPLVATLNYAAGDVAVGNGAVVSLADHAVETLDLSVYPVVAGGAGTVHVIIDVTGYFQ